MRLERLFIDTGMHTFTAEFHRGCTVIGGLDASAREALAGEIIDSLAGARPGVHLELDVGGHALTVFRPTKGRHRVVDTEAVADVTGDHLGPDGSIDLFASLGVDRALGRQTMRLTKEDLLGRAPTDAVVTRLATVDQDALWETAERLRATERIAETIAATSGTSVSDVALMDAVERKHAELVDATESYDRIRLISLTIADIGAIAGLALLFTEGIAGVPFLALAVAGAILGLFYRLRVREATRAERKVLTAAGAEDYTSFHLERVSALLDGDLERRRFMQAVSDHRHAADEWTDLAGDVPVELALHHRNQIRASAELRSGVGSLQTLSAEAVAVPDDVTDELAQVLVARIEAVRALTPGEDSVPLVVDDPFEDLDPNMLPMLLELLVAASGSPQMILLTGDDAVTSWARIEEMTGRLAVVEPVVARSSVPI
ncbi:MAG: hypothetical protein ACSLFO_12750 [Acidimicrobiales bacterium]